MKSAFLLCLISLLSRRTLSSWIFDDVPQRIRSSSIPRIFGFDLTAIEDFSVVVDDFILADFLGEWFEIARTTNPNQNDDDTDTTMTFGANSNGSISALTEGFTVGGNSYDIDGHGVFTGDTDVASFFMTYD